MCYPAPKIVPRPFESLKQAEARVAKDAERKQAATDKAALNALFPVKIAVAPTGRFGLHISPPKVGAADLRIPLVNTPGST